MTFAHKGTILLVDDDAVVLHATNQMLELEGFTVRAFEQAAEALQAIDRDFNGIVVTDIRMPEFDGLQLFKEVRAIDVTIPVIFITGHGDVPMAVSALQEGAHDFLTKPFSSAHLVASATRGLERRQLELDNRMLRRQLAATPQVKSPLVGECPAILRLIEAINTIATSDVDVLIEGETGVGKELVALMLHRQGSRRTQPFINVTCPSLGSDSSSANLVGEFDVLGRKQGPGLIEMANRGTLFLDEIDKLDPSAQAIVLNAIEERQLRGGTKMKPVPVDVRVIATSRRDLRQAVEAGAFREDLFYALNIVRLRIPPLRERKADIPLLYAHFIDEASRQLRRSVPRMTDAVRRRLIEHDWPGNVRELRSFAFQTIVGFDDVANASAPTEHRNLAQRVEQFEEATIRSTLEACNGSAGKAMELLGLPRKTFYDKLNRHQIDIASYRQGAASSLRPGRAKT